MQQQYSNVNRSFVVCFFVFGLPAASPLLGEPLRLKNPGGHQVLTQAALEALAQPRTITNEQPLLISADNQKDKKPEEALANATTTAANETDASENPALAKIDDAARSAPKRLGLGYFTFFFGPGFHPDAAAYNPNQFGKESSNGLYTQNNLSVKYKIFGQYSLDFALRFNLQFNDTTKKGNYTFARWETPRIGISGTLLKGEDWDLTGAVNTDFPSFFPEPLTGYTAKNRTTLFTPGTLAYFTYQQKGSPWSVFSVVEPRYFFYTDPDMCEIEMTNNGLTGQNKAQITLVFRPTINYQISDSSKITLGTSIDYRKQIQSSWNIFDASLVSTGNGKEWRLQPLSINLGITHKFSNRITIYPFIATFPIAAQRVIPIRSTEKNPNPPTEFVPILKSTYFGMWIYGTIL
jgi:hypothetical protein